MIDVVVAQIGDGEKFLICQRPEHNDIAWIAPAEIPNYAFCPADNEINERIAVE